MDARQVADFVSTTHDATRAAWDVSALRAIATRQVPDGVLGGNAWLLQADIQILWARWFVDGLVDRPRFIRDERLGYSQLYSEVRRHLKDQFNDVPADELQLAAVAVAEMAWDEIDRLRKVRRLPITPKVKEDLWFSEEPRPRCYLCGHAFVDVARDRFLGRHELDRARLEPAIMVDFTRPRGLSARDMLVEVDHISPVARGGGTHEQNLRLACGWCNRVKSDSESIYDAPGSYTRKLYIRGLGRVYAPQPLWVLRIVATRGRCEGAPDCSATLQTNELFLAPRTSGGWLTPTNAMVCCASHDPWSKIRYVGVDAIHRP